MNKQALILFTSAPEKDSSRKSKTNTERRILEKKISNAIESFCENYQSAFFDFLIFSDADFNCKGLNYKQRGNSFGEKFTNVLSDAFNLGYEKITIIGNDTFGISTQRIEKCFKQLNEYDLVIGPSYDGGFYLLSISEAAFQKIDMQSIKEIEFQKGKDFNQLLNYFSDCNFKVKILKKMHDADEYEEYCSILNNCDLMQLCYTIRLQQLFNIILFRFAIKKFITSQQTSFISNYLKAPPIK